MAKIPPSDDAAKRAASRQVHAEKQEVGEPSNAYVLDVLRALGAQVEEIGHEMTVDQIYGRKNRSLIGWLALSFALDIVLTLGLGYVYHRVDHNSSAATVNCRSSQQFAAGMNKTFGPALKVALKNPDPAQRKQAQDFKNLLDGLSNKHC